MNRVMYKIMYELGLCMGLLFSRKAILLWVFITIIYILKGN